MRKIYALASALIITMGLNAQNLKENNSNLRPVNFKKSPASVKGPGIHVDYDGLEESIYGTSYQRFIWEIRSNPGTTQGDTADYNYMIVKFDTIQDYNYQTYEYGIDYNSLRVDSILMVCGHENNSGTTNTITFSILGLSNGYPNESNVLYTNNITTTTGLSATNNWLSSALVYDTPGYTVNAEGFAVKVEYTGARQDTFGILSGFYDNSNGAGSGTCTYVADRSLYWPNSYVYHPGFSPTYGILPTSTGADLYYDCDGSGGANFPADSRSYVQNHTIWVYVTLDPTSVEELENLGVALGQNVPNPTEGLTSITYELANASDNVSLEVFDVTGKKVIALNEGSKSAGKYKVNIDLSSFESGVYYYTLTADGISTSKKLILTK
jgi:hypothetical protein